ncbi:MAG: hypothetical protein EXR98_13670 [Gemmataceae bacterium]|nr:hypothetical protein [Gemmataceae bacterium]
MTKIIVDDLLLAKLQNLREPLQLCDASGKKLADVYPAFDPNDWEPLEPQISKEEIERRFKEDKRYSTGEVLAHLESL